MKKKIILLFLIVLSYTGFSQLRPDYSDENRRVFWFDISLQKVKDKETLLPTFIINRKGTRVQYGKAFEYDRYLWQGLSNGSRIAVGPFDSPDQAKFANRLYDMKKAANDSVVQNDNGTYFWYLVTLKKTKRLNSYDFERIPAQVNSGNALDFLTLQKYSLPQDKLVIGPFSTAEEAENSKRVFRLKE